SEESSEGRKHLTGVRDPLEASSLNDTKLTSRVKWAVAGGGAAGLGKIVDEEVDHTTQAIHHLVNSSFDLRHNPILAWLSAHDQIMTISLTILYLTMAMLIIAALASVSFRLTRILARIIR